MKSASKVTESSSLMGLWWCCLPVLLLGCVSDTPDPPAWTDLPLSSFEKSVSEHLGEAILLRADSSKEDSVPKAVAGLLESGKIFQAYGLHLHAAETYRQLVPRRHHQTKGRLAERLADEIDLSKNDYNTRNQLSLALR